MLAAGLILLSACAAKPVDATEGTDGMQSVQVVVRHGYQPQVINAKAGKPLRVEFYRDENPGGESCGEEVVIPAEKIRIRLPARQTRIVEIRPQAAGEMTFRCGMAMMHGKIIFK